MPSAFSDRLKRVFVRQYTRRRFGDVELVRQHWRAWPGQLAFTL
jgi:hypothetical protein